MNSVLNVVLVALIPFVHAIASDEDGSTSRHQSLTVILNPADEACFYQYYPAGGTIMLEYKVMAATYQDHVIGFQLSDLHGRPLVTEFSKQSSWAQFKTTDAGAYRFCFDNTHTRYSKKSVFIRLKDITEANKWGSFNQVDFVPEGDYDGKVEEIGNLMDRVRVNLNGIQESQETHRQIELHDRRTAEDNFSRVNLYSFVCLFCTLSVMLIQVISLRSFFDDKSAVRRFFRQKR